MSSFLFYLLCAGITIATAVGATVLLKWGMNKDLVITFKPFSIKIEEK